MSATPKRNPEADTPLVAMRDVVFAWSPGAAPVLEIPSLEVAAAERIFLRGPSGSGKSTLLNLLAGVVLPQTGSVRVLGRELTTLGGPDRDRFRADHIGFVFQLFNLIPYLSVVENVTLPCLFSGRRRTRAETAGGTVKDEARRLLRQLDMDDPALLQRRVTELSVGQQQRVAAARALISAPELVVADEATSALDADRREAFLDLLFRECERAGAAVVFVSHDASVAHLFDRTVELGALNRAAATA